MKHGLDPALQSLAPGQCVLLSNTGVFHLASHIHNLWLDALYIRLVSSADNATAPADASGRNDAPRALAISSSGSMLFATDVTIQGDGGAAVNQHAGQQAVALWAGSSSMHFEGVLL